MGFSVSAVNISVRHSFSFLFQTSIQKSRHWVSARFQEPNALVFTISLLFYSAHTATDPSMLHPRTHLFSLESPRHSCFNSTRGHWSSNVTFSVQSGKAYIEAAGTKPETWVFNGNNLKHLFISVCSHFTIKWPT